MTTTTLDPAKELDAARREETRLQREALTIRQDIARQKRLLELAEERIRHAHTNVLVAEARVRAEAR